MDEVSGPDEIEIGEFQDSTSVICDSDISEFSLESCHDLYISNPSLFEAQWSYKRKPHFFFDNENLPSRRLIESFGTMSSAITVPLFHVKPSGSRSTRFHERDPPTIPKRNEHSKGKEQSSIEMAIRHASSNFRLTEGQVKFIQSQLVQALDKTPPRSPQPSFLKSFFDQGKFWMACENETSRDWLIENVRILNDTYEDLNLVVEGVKFPKRPIVYLDLPEVSSTIEVLDRLAKQNGNLRTEFWFILRRHLYKAWQRITFSIDIDSFQFLESVNFTVKWKLRSIVFRVPAKVYKRRAEREGRHQEEGGARATF